MSFSFQHAGATLPLAITDGATSGGGRCPSCERAGLDGDVRVEVPVDSESGTLMTSCSNGHMVLVAYTRTG